jgi:transglutaminase-like putative cysteine protease
MSTTEWSKWVYLRDVPAKDALADEVQAVAANLWAVAVMSPNPRWAYAELAHCVARDLIRYATDTDRAGREQIDGLTDPYRSPLEPLARGADDCDAKARLFVALCLAKGIAAEMVPLPSERAVASGSPLQHVSARVFVAPPYFDRDSRTIKEGAKQWLPVETILARAKAGETAGTVPKEMATANWLYS